MELTESGFPAFFEAHYRTILAYANRRVVGRSEAEDVVTEVFTVVWRRRGDLPDDHAEQRMWLYGVARRTVFNQQRGQRRAERLRQRLAAQPQEFTHLEADRSIDTSAALEALSALSASDQELLRLALWEALDHVEIAAIVETSTANVAVRLHRAKKRLREEFSRQVEEVGGDEPAGVEAASDEQTRQEHTR